MKVYVIALNGGKYILEDEESFIEALKSEMFDNPDDTYEVYTTEMSEKEVSELPEFDGF